ncbi:MAG TPA: prepilin-type N-terminal cleavage/methylation domain-containing protein [Patescibacteria group bacterium]|nr:prepilin-type N-terminal cleavage/methylation domain-containing protein [Patescibacteria group bacterium]
MKGFTFIELMVVVAIGAILTAGGLAAYRGIGEKEGLKQSGLGLESNLKLVQRKALSGEKPEGCSGTLESFQVTAGGDDQTYLVQARCSDFSPDAISYQLDKGIKFQPLISQIDFEVLRQGVTGAQTIILTTTAGNFSYQVVVETGGVIRGRAL